MRNESSLDPDDYRPHLSVDKLRPPTSDEWSIVSCSPDGNCFYHALSMSTKKDKPPTKIRDDMLKYIIKQGVKIPASVIRRISKGIRSNIENESISVDGWAHHEEIQICSKMYDLVICVWNSDHSMWTACFPKEKVYLLSECRKVIYMCNGGNHFDLLKRKPCSSHELV